MVRLAIQKRPQGNFWFCSFFRNWDLNIFGACFELYPTVKQYFILFSFVFFVAAAQGQSFEIVNTDTINLIDTAGKKQGLWKYWDNNLSLAMSCYYKDDNPVGKLTYYHKNKTIFELEPRKGKAELSWRYYGNGKPVTGKLKRNARGKFEFLNVQSKRLTSKEIDILIELMQQEASYVGGYYEMFRYFKEHIKFPQSAKEARKEGIVEVTFWVRENGTIDDVRLVSGFDVDCNEAALECVKSMPRWRPATKIGYTFESQVKVPVQFKL